MQNVSRQSDSALNMEKSSVMEKLINFVDKYKIIVFMVLGMCCLINFAIAFQNDIPLKENLLFLFASIGFFLVWGAGFLVLGLQHINPFCPKSVFSFMLYLLFIRAEGLLRSASGGVH